jgi:hypothetical protein
VNIIANIRKLFTRRSPSPVIEDASPMQMRIDDLVAMVADRDKTIVNLRTNEIPVLERKLRVQQLEIELLDTMRVEMLARIEADIAAANRRYSEAELQSDWRPSSRILVP